MQTTFSQNLMSAEPQDDNISTLTSTHAHFLKYFPIFWKSNSYTLNNVLKYSLFLHLATKKKILQSSFLHYWKKYITYKSAFTLSFKRRWQRLAHSPGKTTIHLYLEWRVHQSSNKSTPRVTGRAVKTQWQEKENHWLSQQLPAFRIYQQSVFNVYL